MPVSEKVDARIDVAPAPTQAFDPGSSGDTKEPRSRSRLVATVVVVLLTLCLLEGLARVIAAVGQYNPVTTDEFYLKKALAETPESVPAIIFVGSSYTDRSVYSDLLAQRFHRAGYAVAVKNLAMLGRGGAPQAQLKLLQAAVNSGTKPLAVFYDVSPLLGYLAEREQKYLIPSGNSLPYLFLYREKLAALLRTLPSLVTAPDTTPPGVFAAHPDHVSPCGWNPNFGIADSQALDQSLTVRKNLIGQERFGPQCFRLLAPVRDYCERINVPLIFVWYPTTEASDELYSAQGLPPQEFARICQSTANQWHNSFLNLHMKLDPLCFSDCDHLNACGAGALTEKIAQILMQDPFRQILPLEHK